MAIDYTQRYPDQTDTDANYPQGKARNKSTPVATDGTPFEEDYINDQWGFFQALLKDASITPSGNADNANTSQYLEALKSINNSNLFLKIFQSPSPEGLTEIQTRTTTSGEVYEVRKASDGTLANIYKDAAGTVQISQNNTSNVSDRFGAVEFFIDYGSYYIKVNSSVSNFTVSNSRINFKDLSEVISSDLDVGSEIHWMLEDEGDVVNKNGGTGIVVDYNPANSGFQLDNGNYVYRTDYYGPVRILTPQEAPEDHLLFKTKSSAGPTRIHIEPAGNIEGTTAKLDWMFDPYDETPVPSGRQRDYRIFNIYNKTGDVSGLNGENGAAVMNVKSVGDFWGVWPSMHFSISDDASTAMKMYYFDMSEDNEWFTPMKGRWREGAEFSVGDYVTCDNKVYQCQTEGTSGVSRLTHEIGTVSDGNLDWLWIRSPLNSIENIKPTMLFGDIQDMPVFGYPEARAQLARDLLVQQSASVKFIEGDDSYVGKFKAKATEGILEYETSTENRVQFGQDFFKLEGITQRYDRLEKPADSGSIDFLGTSTLAISASSPVNVTDFLNIVPDSILKIIPRDDNVTLVFNSNKIRLTGGVNLALSSNNFYTFYVDSSGIVRQQG